MVMGYAVKSFERPDWLLPAYALPAVVAVMLETGFVYLWGLAGAAWGLLISQAFTAAMVVIFYKRLPSKMGGSPVEHEAGETVRTT
jgi:Na+-driven multidrug efflux pump